MKFVPAIVLVIVLAISPTLSVAQELPPSEQGPPTHQNFAAHLLRDQASMWSGPAKLKRDDFKWLVPLGAGAATLLLTDRKVGEEVREAESIRPFSKMLSKFGGGGPMAGAAGTLFAVGKLSGNNKAAKTGGMALEAVLQTQFLVGGIKLIANRERPNEGIGEGQFFSGGRSFPSGHAATTFAFATVVADQYKNKPWVAVGAYGLATAVSLSRVGGLNHFPSDVLIGGSIGYLIGKFVLRRHKDQE